MKKKNKIFIAGCGGMLGDAFYNTLINKYDLLCTDIDCNETWIKKLDFRNRSEYIKIVNNFKPDYLFHIGAHTNLEFCETNQDDAYSTNTLSVETAIFIANKLDIPLIYISTAGIFDGKKDYYDDWDIPNPLGHYARSKHIGEKLIVNSIRRYLICRAGWMMGGGPKKDKKFVNKLMNQIKQGKKELFIVDDKLGTPTYTYDFVKNLEMLMKMEMWGLYNLVCSDTTSRFEVAKEVLAILKLQDEIKITPVSSSYWKEEYFAQRPKSEMLLTKKLDILGLNMMRGWKVCLNEYLSDQYSSFFK